MFQILLAIFGGAGAVALYLANRHRRSVARRWPARLVGEDSVGTLAWLEDNPDGRLDPLDRFEFQGLVWRRLPELPLEILTRYLRWERKRDVAPEVINPEGPFADKVLEICEAMGPPWLINHSRRTYELAYLYGNKAGYPFDKEVLWGACLLHDVGLAERASAGALPAEGPACFSIRSAEVACAIAEDHAWSADRVDSLREAITLHLNPAVPRALGIEAWLLHFATGLDITGVGFARLYSDAMDDVIDRHGLLRQRDALLPVWNNEAANHPTCRAAALNGLRFTLAFNHLVESSPLYRVYA